MDNIVILSAQAEGISLRALWEQMEELIDLLEQVENLFGSNLKIKRNLKTNIGNIFPLLSIIFFSGQWRFWDDTPVLGTWVSILQNIWKKRVYKQARKPRI